MEIMIKSIEKGRKEDGNRSIADKIIKRLDNLEMMSEHNKGRWLWELFQNAKDSVVDGDRKVSIAVEVSNDKVVFSHNGDPFTEKDIRGLINQISSKEVEEEDVQIKTGKFGTGFLSTHLLSRIIKVSGIVKTDDGSLYGFDFPLNRTGKTTTQFIPLIEAAWTAFYESAENNQIREYGIDGLNTSFEYHLSTNEQKSVAQAGIDELGSLIQYVLLFNDRIESVEIHDQLKGLHIGYSRESSSEEDILVRTISKKDLTDGTVLERIHTLIKEGEDVAIAAPVKKKKGRYSVSGLEKLPKLFCDFPLTGSDGFHFPVIVNSFQFNPLDERDGIWLEGDTKQKVIENREILIQAMELYKEMLDEVSGAGYTNLYHLCNTKMPSVESKYFDKSWYKTEVQESLREYLKGSALVETEDGELAKMDEVRFPDPNLRQDDREKIWEISSDLTVNTLPKKKDIHEWCEYLWSDCYLVDVDDIVTDIKGNETLEKLTATLERSVEDTILWLNSTIEFIESLVDSTEFDQFKILPDQNGDFQCARNLYVDAIGYEEVKQAADCLGYEYYSELIDKRIVINYDLQKIALDQAASKIMELIDEDQENTVDRITAITIMIEWFENHSKEGAKYFRMIYEKKEKYLVDIISDKDNLYKVLRSQTPLSTLAEVAEAIQNDPEILKIIERRRMEKEEEELRTRVGENVEKILKDALQQFGYEVKKEVLGKDLVVKLTNDDKDYSIEVKSRTTTKEVLMTPFQGFTAMQNQGNYALCVVHTNGQDVNTESITSMCTFLPDIGQQLTPTICDVSSFEDHKRQLLNSHGRIGVHCENDIQYKYRIDYEVWSEGIGFHEFIEMLRLDIKLKHASIRLSA